MSPEALAASAQAEGADMAGAATSMNPSVAQAMAAQVPAALAASAAKLRTLPGGQNLPEFNPQAVAQAVSAVQGAAANLPKPSTETVASVG